MECGSDGEKDMGMAACCYPPNPMHVAYLHEVNNEVYKFMTKHNFSVEVGD